MDNDCDSKSRSLFTRLIPAYKGWWAVELYHGRYPNLVDPARRILLIRVICVICVIRDSDNTIPARYPLITPPDHRPLILAIP